MNFGTDAGYIALPGRVQALFTYLCVTRQPQDRNKLADLLWDNHSDQKAKSNLRYIVRDLRQVIGDYLIVDGPQIAFNFALPHWFDITVFATYLAPNKRDASSPLDPEILHELLNLYAGDFLTGFYIENAANFERWVSTQRRYFHDALVYGLQLAVQQHLERGEYEAGLTLNHYLLTLEPWREETHRQHMLLLAASGQRSAALIQYELCCQTLEEELDAPPMNETTSLYTKIKSGLWFVEQQTVANFSNQRIAVRAYPQASSIIGTAASNQLAALALVGSEAQVDLGAMSTIDALIGRRQEVDALQRWLDDDTCRVAAILGLSGQGKSALAAWFVQVQCAQLTGTPQKELPTQREPVKMAQWQNKPLPPPVQQADRGAKAPLGQIIWRTLAQRPTCLELLQDLVQRITTTPISALPPNVDQLATILFAALQQKRCLLVLDSVEAILAYTTQEEREEATAYEQLFQLFMERRHSAHLLLVSRLRPAILTRLQEQKRVVCCLPLAGLMAEESEQFLRIHGVDTDASHYQRLHEWYAGNPQMLSRVVDLIYELFDGDVDVFLQQEVRFPDAIGGTFARQITDLPRLSRQIVEILTKEQQTLSHQSLWVRLAPTPPKAAFYDALRDLQRTYFIQQTSGRFTVEPLLAAWLTDPHLDKPESQSLHQ